MCLELTPKTLDRRTAARDIKVYKILKVANGRLFSPYQNMEYELGTLYKAQLNLIVHTNFISEVHEGFHSFVRKKDAIAELDSALHLARQCGHVFVDDPPFVIATFTVPVASEFYYGWWRGAKCMASDTIVMDKW